MPNIPYPNVPDADGVPNVPRNPNQPYVPPNGSGAVSTTVVQVQSNQPQWAILDNNGGTLIQFDSIIEFDVKGSTVISNFPVEKGSFSSYNQVEKPYSVKITGAASGKGNLSQGQILQNIFDLRRSLDLSTVVTPYATYSSNKLIDYSYAQRSERGLTLLLVTLIFQEVRTTAISKVTPAQPSGQSKKKVGQVSPTTPSTAVASQTKPLAFKP